ncbi:MAG: alpha/beta hydrolase, partial [Deltaproteobacteria bacterium]|nr:alpha/beta hydrolase [Deltaproteobacteria bacterium]
MTSHAIAGSPELVAIAAGPTGAPAIVFVHGIAQSKRVFERVLAGPLAAHYRLVAFDLRGHGDSELPAEPLARPQLAGDLARVIAALELERPVIAPWSFGGVVLGEYLRRHGDGALGGIVSLAASVRNGRDAAHLFGGAMMNHARDLLSPDPAVYAAAARAFLAGASAAPLAADVGELLLAEMLRVPAAVRRALLAGGEDYTPELAATRVPIAVIQGELD